ncbi:hypothetical protein [Rhizobium leucaenae]|uniref:hypothetical protein n=1 Tax=Rhizobium leucaenae TaxID=29450 RepID=UPI00181E2497|nr:hypothetical protein [Rhizobium leucaenae]MBB6304686.1 hypothetical protein [Rhizobium leucaenae]
MNDALFKLPLFATDKELAVAIVGKERAAMWMKAVIPVLERKGFPRIDPLHDGRPVPLVWKFYDGYFGITAGFNVAAPDGEERLGLWKRSKQRPRDDKSKLNIDGNVQPILRFMVNHPDCTTPDVIPGAGIYRMEKLAKLGAIVEIDRNSSGARQWIVTDEGRAAVKR